MDRNSLHTRFLASLTVALLAEGVDRNQCSVMGLPHLQVALLAEGVDRNMSSDEIDYLMSQSPSSRRAWIEIRMAVDRDMVDAVALLAEGVDRNSSSSLIRRRTVDVALLAEGVDRNFTPYDVCRCMAGRPPRGGRG